MIVFDKLWKTMEVKGITQYDLYTYHDISKYTLDRLRHNKNVETLTLNKICQALNCDISEIAGFVRDEANQELSTNKDSCD